MTRLATDRYANIGRPSLPGSRLVAYGLLLSCLVLVGCRVPIDKREITYYQPHAASGMTLSSSSGPDNEALFELKNPDIRTMIVAQPSYDPPRIWMSIHLEQGLDMKVVGDHFTITALDNSPTRTAPIDLIRGTFMMQGEGIYRDFKVGDDLKGASDKAYTRFWGKETSIARHYVITAPLGDTKTNQLPEEFELLLPEILISGKPLELPPLYFARKVGKFYIKENVYNQPW